MSDNQCRTCPAGWFSPNSISSCKDCTAGTYQNEDVNPLWSCKNCGPGQYTPETKTEKCTNCGAGKYQSESGLDVGGSSVCINCPSGYYGPNEGLSSCQAFPPGKYWSGATGATSLNQGSSCQAGRYSDGGSASCAPCPRGKYGTEEGATSAECMSCNKNGDYQDEKGMKKCKQCIIGQASPKLNLSTGVATMCVKCQSGQYQDESAATSYGCKSCDLGQFTTD